MNRPQAMTRAFEFAAKSDIEGDYFEFGVFQGLSLINALRARRHFSEKLRRPICPRLFAFDSFAGLPALTDQDQLAGYGIFKEGQYACGREEVEARVHDAGFSTEDIRFVEGFYAEALRAPETLRLVDGTAPAIVHIDCDLYSSAADCFAFLDGRLQDGAVMLLDDWFCYRGRPDRGVRAAFDGWVSGSRYVATEYFRYSWAGLAFILNIR